MYDRTRAPSRAGDLMKSNTITMPVISDCTSSLFPPVGGTELGNITDSLNYNQRFTFFLNNKALTIIESREIITPKGKVWKYFPQKDFPLEFITWFPKALEQFRDPDGPFEGLMTPKICVGGEMLAICREIAAGGNGIPGYGIYNFSRTHSGYSAPMSISWMESFLYEGGMLKFIKGLSKAI